MWEVPRLSLVVEGQRHRRRNWVEAADELPVVPEGDMSRKYANESTDPLTGRLGVEVGRTARAARINRSAVKSSCAWEWGAWDQLSDDGPGHYNPDRSEGPWGRAALAARTVVHQRTALLGSERG